MKSAFESPGIIGIRSGDIGKVCALRAQILYIWPLHASVWEIIFTCTIDSPAAPPRKNFPHFRTTDEMTGKIFIIAVHLYQGELFSYVCLAIVSPGKGRYPAYQPRLCKFPIKNMGCISSQSFPAVPISPTAPTPPVQKFLFLNFPPCIKSFPSPVSHAKKSPVRSSFLYRSD